MNRRGFTLVETLIVIFLFSLVMLAVIDMYLSFNRAYSKQAATINTSLTAAALIDEFSRTALQASAVTASRTYGGTTYTSNATTAVFTLPSVDSSGNILTNTYDYAIFYVTGSTSYRILDVAASSARPAGQKKLSDVIGELTYSYNNASPSLATKITIDATTTATTESQTFQTHLSKEINLRNI